MKKLYILIAIISLNYLMCAGAVKAQWVPQYTGTDAIIRDIEFLNVNTGWAVGDGGTCLKTTNGGINWVQQNQPAGNKPFNSVHIVDSNIVYIVGYFETILKTTSGGADWQIIKNGPYGQGGSYFGVYFLNKDTGWVGGTATSQYNLLYTKNGFISYDTIFMQDPIPINDIVFINKDTGYVCSDGVVMRTTNSGINWNNSLPFTGGLYRKISFLKNGYGWVTASSGWTVFRTTNFGDSWQCVNDSMPGGNYGIFFINKDTGFVGGGGNCLLKTTNGGYNWKYENVNIFPDGFESIEFVNDTVGWICATGGIILKTTTQGETLTRIDNQGIKIAENYYLLKNYPNPFNSQTIISFTIPKRGLVNISIYDMQGRKIDELLNRTIENGTYEIKYDARSMSSGIYFYTMSVDGQILKTNKLILIK